MRICSIAKCEKTYYAKGYCRKHYSYNHYQAICRRKDNHKCKTDNCNKNILSIYQYCYWHRKQIRKDIDIINNPPSPGAPKGSRNGRWNGGISVYKNHYLLKKNRETKLLQCNYRCESCGAIASITHHIDGSKINHSMDNLQALCPTCHYKTIKHTGRPKKYGDLSLKQMAGIIGCSIRSIDFYLTKKFSNSPIDFSKTI